MRERESERERWREREREKMLICEMLPLQIASHKTSKIVNLKYGFIYIFE